MLTLKNLSPYVPEYKELIMPDALFLQTDEGLDWYYYLLKFSDNTVKVAYDSNSVVRFIEKEAAAIWPDNLSVTEIDLSNVHPDADVSGNWTFDGVAVVPRTYNAKEKLKLAQDKCDGLISSARLHMNEWQNDLMLGTINDEDKNRLSAWNGYVKKLKGLDLSLIDEIQWPEAPQD